ncbi:MAG: TrkH family potassium uptake protein [Lachnospiraceae bacterium]|nr:TrkH family potassium uptake protein [Lachnospiraceae bacterium]
MNSSMIRYLLGSVLKIEGALLFLPCLVSLCYQEKVGFFYVSVAVFCLLLGFVMTLKKPKDTVFYLKEGCVTTALSWIFMSFFGALPFWLSGEIPSLTDALFETVSGFTTTGASILTDVEALSYTALFWRSFTHWIGGMGVLVFLLAIISLSGGSHINLLRAESPGPSVGKLVPKMKHTARILYLIYLGMTLIEIVLLLVGKMSLFDALTTSFGTAGTGGFGIKADSMGGYSPYIQWVVTIFMIAFGVNFNAYYFILFHNAKKAFRMEEVRYYLGIIVAAIGILLVDTVKIYGSFSVALRHSAFQVGSIITTTGFSTVDFDLWSQTSKTVLVLLMFIGACAGSTGGGIKVSRFIILIKTILKELNSYIHPRSIKKITYDDRPIEHEVMRSTNVYFMTFVVLFTASVLVISLEDWDLTTNFTAVAATINNIGPGLELVGPSRNFSFFSPLSKYVLIFDMLAGRLELFPLLILFHPAIWKELYAHKSAVRKLKKKKAGKDRG